MMEERIKAIAKSEMGIHTLVETHHKNLDTIVTTVQKLTAALKAAYMAGTQHHAYNELDFLAQKIEDAAGIAATPIKTKRRSLNFIETQAVEVKDGDTPYIIDPVKDMPGRYYLAEQGTSTDAPVHFSKDELIENLKKW